MSELLRILVLAANPKDTSPVSLEAECNLLRDRMRDNAKAGNCELSFEWAARVKDLRQILEARRPHVVHFAGHGTQDGLCLEGEERKTQTLSKEQLASVFDVVRQDLRLLVLNACYSTQQVEKLATMVDYIIGSPNAIPDDDALQFSAQFYRSLAIGGTVRDAFYKAQGQVVAHAHSVHVTRYEFLVRPGTDETLPLLLPVAASRIRTAMQDLKVDVMNIGHLISEGQGPVASACDQPRNQNSELTLSGKTEARKINFGIRIISSGGPDDIA